MKSQNKRGKPKPTPSAKRRFKQQDRPKPENGIGSRLGKGFREVTGEMLGQAMMHGLIRAVTWLLHGLTRGLAELLAALF